MVQPKYSPEEALQRIKLMMKYDSSKTLNENKEIVSEQTSTNLAHPTTLGAGLVGAGMGATAAGGGISAAMTAGATLGSVFPVVGTAVGAIAGIGLGMLTNWYAYKDYGKSGFEQVMSACKSAGADKLVPKMSKSDIRSIAYQIEDAKGQWNDDEDAIASALQKIESVADLCAVDKKVTGGLLEFLDNLTDSPDEWKMFTRPLAGMIEDTEVILPPEEQKKIEGGDKNVSQQKRQIPTELKDIEGVKKFQDWLDVNAKGWATGYKEGIVNKGVNGGGYGNFGPRTSKAWLTYKDQYLKKQEPSKDEIRGEKEVINVSDL